MNALEYPAQHSSNMIPRIAPVFTPAWRIRFYITLKARSPPHALPLFSATLESHPLSEESHRFWDWLCHQRSSGCDAITQAPPYPVNFSSLIATRITLYGGFSASTVASTLGPHRERSSFMVPITYSFDSLFEVSPEIWPLRSTLVQLKNRHRDSWCLHSILLSRHSECIREI